MSRRLDYLPDDAPEWAKTLNSNIMILQHEMRAISEGAAKLTAVIEQAAPVVTEVVAGLQDNPMLKMLTSGTGGSSQQRRLL